MQTGQHVKLALERGEKEDGSEDGGVPGVDWRGAALVGDQETHLIRVLGACVRERMQEAAPGNYPAARSLAARTEKPKRARAIHRLGLFAGAACCLVQRTHRALERISRGCFGPPQSGSPPIELLLFGSRLDGQKRPREHCAPLLSEKTP